MEDKKDQSYEEALAAVVEAYQSFDPEAYLEYNYTPPRADFTREDSIVRWKLECFHWGFQEGDLKGDVLVDVGSGPTLYQVMSGCERFKRVILSDYLEVNRKELQKWLKGESKMDWTPFLQYVCEQEGRSPSESSEKAAHLRSVVSDVVHVDILRPSPISADVLPPAGADCVVSCFCLETASPDMPSFVQSLRNLSNMLRSGGHAMLIVALGMKYYLGQEGKPIPVVYLDEAQVCSCFKESGFILQNIQFYTFPPDMNKGSDDIKGVAFVKARKP